MRRFHTYAAAALLVLAGCAGPGLFAGEPAGKQLERALKQIEDQCRAAGAPPFGENKPGQFETACLMFTLKPWEPGDTPESAFAHSIKLPPPHDKPKDVYKPSMSSEEYFKALCEAEAGEWVFRRVEGVRGIRQERPKLHFPPGYSGIVFSTSEKAHYMDSDMHGYFIEPPVGRYSFLEVVESKSGAIPQYVRYSPASLSVGLKTERTNAPQANHAFVWRGIRRPLDREHAIDGFEIIVYQITPFEVLAFERGFGYRAINSSTKDPRTPRGAGCTGSNSTPPKFIENVLIPSQK